MKVYVLFDKVSHQFSPVFQQATDDSCRRSIKADQNIMNQLDDFDICCFAEIHNLDTFEIIPDDLDFSGVIRLVKKLIFVSLKDFLGISEESPR